MDNVENYRIYTHQNIKIIKAVMTHLQVQVIMSPHQ